MHEPARPPRPVRFGAFELDPRAGELRKHGRKLKLHGQPIDVLAMLLEHPGEVVTREELQKKLWPTDTFVDFDHSLNTAINKLRETLGDSAENPRFVETVPRRGYRFIAPVDGLERRLRARIKTSHFWLAGLVMAAVLAVVVGLNVGGLRDRVLGTAPPPPIQSIAVLPLANRSGDAEQEYFVDGMTDALIAELGQIGALRVISRQSVMRYKDTDKSLPEIARELNVDAVVEGSVLRSGERVRVTAQLIRAKPERHLWAETFDRDLGDVLALHSDVVQAIADEIKAAVTPEERTRLATARPVNPEAHEAYLRGRYLQELPWGGDTEARRKALQYFQEAIEVDPTYAPAYAGLADAYMFLAGSGELRPREAYPKAKAAVSKALEIDETLPEAHLALGRVKVRFDWDWKGAEEELKRAIDLNPNYARAYGTYAYYCRVMGRWDEDLANLKRQRELDPPAWPGKPMSLAHYWAARQYDKLIELSLRVLEMEPNSVWAHVFLGLAYVQKGMYEEAAAVFEKALELSPGSQMIKSQLARAYAEDGQTAEAQRILRELEDLYEREFASPFFIAIVYVGLGEKDKAFEWLERTYQERTDDITGLKIDPWLDPLRSDPRFNDLLRRMNFPE